MAKNAAGAGASSKTADKDAKKAAKAAKRVAAKERRGQIWQAGRLIASVAQEGLVRPRWDKDTSLGDVAR